MKKLTLLFVSLFCVVTAMAQTSVQGVPRQLSASKHQVATRNATTGSEYVDFSRIQFWTGEGTDSAALVIKWPKADGTSVSLVWGYCFNGQATGLEMIEAVTKADPSLSLLTQITGIYGSTICGIGYGDVSDLSFDLDGANADSHIMFGYYTPNSSMGQTRAPGDNTAAWADEAIEKGLEFNGGVIDHPFNQKLYGYPAYDYDWWQLTQGTSTNALWRSGWYEGYWSYWVKSSANDTFGYSGLGASSHTIQNGCVDGWSYCADMSSWTGASMTGEYIYVPAGGCALGQSANSVVTKTSAKTGSATLAVPKSEVADCFGKKHFIVHSISEFGNALAEMKEMGKGDEGCTIEFDAALKGQTFLAPWDIWQNYVAYNTVNVPLKVIGNGVTIDGVDNKLVFGTGSANFTVENLTLKNIHSLDTPIYDNEVLIKDCRFIGCYSALRATVPKKYSAHLRIENCQFLSPTIQAGDEQAFCSYSSTSTTARIEFVSCTFAGADLAANKMAGLYITSKTGVAKLINCVFDDNKTSSAYPDVNFFLANDLGLYNVVNGYVSSTITYDETNFVGEYDAVVKIADDGIAYPLASGKAFAHFPANTVIEGFTMPETDMLGNAIDYTLTNHSGAVQTILKEETPSTEVDYTKGTFIVNEDWYGHQNSTVNFLTDKGEWVYRVVQKENPGVELGCTNQFGTIYGNRFYLIAKQDKDPGATTQGARITICDAKTMKVLKQIPVIATTADGTSNADGRGFLGVDEHKGYVGTSNGIYVLDLDAMEIKGGISGSGNGTDDPYQSLYGGQIGNMVRVNDRVFAVHQQLGVLVIDPYTDTVETVVEAPGKDEGWGFGTIVLSKDGNLWMSVSAVNGSGTAAKQIVKLNPATLETTVIDLSDDVYGPGNSWYAWTPDCFCASTQNNVLYWNGGPNSWFSNKQIFKYDIDNDNVSTFLDYNDDPDGWQIYGCSFRIDPVTDEAYASLYKSFGDPTYLLRKYDNEGALKAEYSMITNYWFPSLPVFPDNAAPVASALPARLVSDVETLSLSDLATDADNMQAAIVKTITSITDETILSAKMENGDLVITPLKPGMSRINLQVNSNGKLAESSLIVQVSNSVGVESVEKNNVTILKQYSPDGKIVGGDYHGVVIMKMSDGTTCKVVR